MSKEKHNKTELINSNQPKNNFGASKLKKPELNYKHEETHYIKWKSWG